MTMMRARVMISSSSSSSPPTLPGVALSVDEDGYEDDESEGDDWHCDRQDQKQCVLVLSIYIIRQNYTSLEIYLMVIIHKGRVIFK